MDQAGPPGPVAAPAPPGDVHHGGADRGDLDLPAAEARRRNAAIVYLCSLPAWITVSEECDLSAEYARRGIAWAIDTLVGALRQEHQQHESQQQETEQEAHGS